MDIIKAMRIEYDHTFTTYDHKPGTNLYSFQYPEHWLSYNSYHKRVKVRSVRVNAASRNLFLRGINLYKNGTVTNGINISFNISLASGEGMNVFNSKLENVKQSIQNEYTIEVENGRLEHPSETSLILFNTRDYEINYNYESKSLNFDVRGAGMYFVFDNNAKASDDLLSILNLEDNELFLNINEYQKDFILPQREAELNAYFESIDNDVNIEFYGKELHKLVFNNVWNRDKIIITSSLSSLCENRYLMLSNTVNMPPKTFEINGFNKGFELNLLNLDDNSEVELPADGKDKIVVEMILEA